MRKRLEFKDLPSEIRDNIEFPKEGGWKRKNNCLLTYEQVVAIRVMEYRLRPLKTFLQGKLLD